MEWFVFKQNGIPKTYQCFENSNSHSFNLLQIRKSLQQNTLDTIEILLNYQQHKVGISANYFFSFCFLCFLKIIFGGHKSFLWGRWYPCFGLLVTSPLGFKARVGSLIHTWQRHMCYMFPEIHLLCDTCQYLGGQHGSWAVLFHIPASRFWLGSKPGSVVP